MREYLSKHEDWSNNLSNANAELAGKLLPWLLDKGSLTSALMKLSDGNFKVDLLRQVVGKAYTHEKHKLNLDIEQESLIREVELNIFDVPVVFARSVIPSALLGPDNGNLENLGTKPLGHLLFREGKSRASKREYTSLKVNNNIIHARRTPYEYQGQQVLVSEFFLPSFLSFIEPT